MSSKLDPYDVDALERSLNDSATRVSTIWVTFLIFGLYLIIATGVVTHRQLLLEDPVKLPVLNIDLPLYGYFVVAPLIFILLHAYVLLQVLLLARTAKAYNDAVDRAITSPAKNASIRQRLANTIFAQIFAGAPRERTGTLGRLLRLLAWGTLVVIPFLVLTTFQLKFLAYHSHHVTWFHRILILIELSSVVIIWPAILDAEKDVSARGTVQIAAFTLILGYLVMSFPVISFPGEPLLKFLGSDVSQSGDCERLVSFSERFDHLELSREDFVDDKKLQEIEVTSAAKGFADHEGERTRNFRHRDLSCANFQFADLRRVDLTGAQLFGTSFRSAELQGAALGDSHLSGSDLREARLQGASLTAANASGVDFQDAQLQGAALDGAMLQGSRFVAAQLQGASLSAATLSGATFVEADLQGATLIEARMEGVQLNSANLRGAMIRGARLQGAALHKTNLEGASLERAFLQGTWFDPTDISFANLAGAHVWRSAANGCQNATLDNLQFAPLITKEFDVEKRDFVPVAANAESIAAFIRAIVGALPPHQKDEVEERLKNSLADITASGDAYHESLWRQCQARSRPAEAERRRLELLKALLCNAKGEPKEVSQGIARGWMDETESVKTSIALAQLIVKSSVDACLGFKNLPEAERTRIRKLADLPQAQSK